MARNRGPQFYAPPLFEGELYDTGPQVQPTEVPLQPAPLGNAVIQIDDGVQLTFLPEANIPEVRQTKRAAFGRYVGPEHFDVFNEHDFSTLTPEDKRAMSPGALRAMLFPDKGVEVPNRVFNVTLNPYEYGIIIRSRDPNHIRNSSFNRTMGYDRPDEEVLARANRSGNHTLEAKVDAMTTHTAKLQTSHQQLGRLERRAAAPGRGHETDQNLRELYANAWLEFENMMDVAHVVAGWTDEQRERADTAFLFYLTQGPQNTRTTHWRTMLSLAKSYVGVRIARFEERTSWAIQNLEQHGVDVSSQEDQTA